MIIKNKMLLSFYRLKQLVRYNHRIRVKEENVAEHSYYVSLFTLMICTKFNVSSAIRTNALTKAILHDLPEMETGDFPHDMKVANPDVVTALDILEEKYYNKHFPEYSLLMKDNGSIVSTIVKLADIYSVRQYCMSEIAIGNTTLSDIVVDTDNRIARYEAILKQRIDIYKEGK